MVYGVTSLNSVGDPVYRAAETREAFTSGQRVGPRFFATGEAIDGERIYYNFMRPTNGSDETVRAGDLPGRGPGLRHGEDLRAPSPRGQREDHPAGARLDEGLDRLALHALADGLRRGRHDACQRHHPDRVRLHRSSAGISYEDMRSVFKRTDSFDISTTFSSTLYADDPTMVEDPRLTTLNTPWDQALLVPSATRRYHRSDRAPGTACRRRSTPSRPSVAAEESSSPGRIHRWTTSRRAPPEPPRAGTPRGRRAVAGAAVGHDPRRLTEVGVGDDLEQSRPGRSPDLAFISGDPLTTIEDLANVQGDEDGRSTPYPSSCRPSSRRWAARTRSRRSVCSRPRLASSARAPPTGGTTPR